MKFAPRTEVEDIRERQEFDKKFRAIFEPVVLCHLRIQEELPADVLEAMERCAALLRKEFGKPRSDEWDGPFRLLIIQHLFVTEALDFYRRHLGPLHLLPNERKSWPKVVPKERRRPKGKRRKGWG